MSRLNRKEQGNFKYYIAEIIILILGISISFLINEWRLNALEKNQQVKLLKDFQSNLVADTIAIGQISKNLKIQQEASTDLLRLKNGDVFKDSTALNFLRTLSYTPFTPTQITYEQMRSQGTSSLISNDSIAKQIISLYEVNYKIVLEWTEIDGNHVKETLIPYTSKNFPFVANLAFPLMDDRGKKQFMDELQKDELKYILQFLLVYKASTKAVFDSTKNLITELLAEIDQELKRLQD